MKKKYRTPGINKNKKIKEARKKPLSLMEHTYDKSKGLWIQRRSSGKDINDSKDV